MIHPSAVFCNQFFDLRRSLLRDGEIRFLQRVERSAHSADIRAAHAAAGLLCTLAQGRTPPVLRNCIVQGNSLSDDGSASEYSVSDADSTGLSPTFEHCLAPVALAGTGNVQSTARFRDASYTPYQNSPGVNAGSAAGYEDILSGKDVIGRPRIIGKAIDIGAVEAASAGIDDFEEKTAQIVADSHIFHINC